MSRGRQPSRQRTPVRHCRISRTKIKAAPLRGAAPGCALRRACGPDGPTRRSAPSQLAACADLLAIRCCVTCRYPPQLRSASTAALIARPGVAARLWSACGPSLGPQPGSRFARPARPEIFPELSTVVARCGRCGCRTCEGNILAARDRPVCGSWRRGRWGADRRAALPPGRITQRKESPDEYRCCRGDAGYAQRHLGGHGHDLAESAGPAPGRGRARRPRSTPTTGTWSSTAPSPSSAPMG